MRDYVVIYKDGRRTTYLTEEEAQDLFETFDEAVMLLKIVKIKEGN